MKVIYTGYDIRQKYKTAEWDGTIIRSNGENYARIDGELQHKSFVFPDTPENRRKLEHYQASYEAWKKAEPNVYELLNSMDKLAQ